MNPRRQWRKLLTALTVAISMAVAPAAMADMNGYDISNWQCGIDTATVPGRFRHRRHHMGIRRRIRWLPVQRRQHRREPSARRRRQQPGRETGVYHYARGGNPETEARFFVDNVRGYVHKSVLIL